MIWTCTCLSIGSTYIALPHKFAYLSLITDAYSKKIVGWSLQETLQLKGPVEALKMALANSKSSLEGLIHRICDDVCIGSVLIEACNIARMSI